jgi:aldose sugar dehydrogenase
MMYSGPSCQYLLLLLFSVPILILIFIPAVFNQSLTAFTVDYSYSNKPVLSDPNLDVELVAKGIRFPTSMAFLDTDDILVLEKNNGTVTRILNGTVLTDPLLDVNVANQEERGMLGIDISIENGSKYVFTYFTEMDGNDSSGHGGGEDSTDYNGTRPSGNRLYRYEFLDNKLENPKLLLDLPAEPGSYHNGGVVRVGPDNSIYLVIGDVGYYDYFEEYPPLDGRSGVLRIPKESGILGNSDNIQQFYYAYGIRNSFGIDFDPVTGRLWDSENGPGFADEINLVERGSNSGWPVIQGIWKVENYSDGRIVLDPKEVTLNFGNYNTPQFVWRNTIGPTAIKFINSPNYGKQYENDIIVGDFIEGNLYHFDLNNNRTQLALQGSLKDKIADNSEELQNLVFGMNFGGITDIEIGPDGYLYILAIQRGGHNCSGSNDNDCIKYSSAQEGAVYKITPKA